MEKIKLYHLSNRDINNRISINYFNANSYTLNDYKISSIKRVFYYTDLKNIEYHFKSYKYLYTLEVNKKTIYDLNIDILKLKNKFNIINDLLFYLKKRYTGIFYSIDKLNIVILFKSIKYKNKVLNVT